MGREHKGSNGEDSDLFQDLKHQMAIVIQQFVRPQSKLVQLKAMACAPLCHPGHNGTRDEQEDVTDTELAHGSNFMGFRKA
jgi:hypothetical protein